MSSELEDLTTILSKCYLNNREHSYTMNIEEKILDILKSVDWQRFHNLCISIGKELNDRQWRFLKAIFLENAIAEYSGNLIKYVGQKEVGCDFIIPSLDNLSIEMKYTDGCLFGGKKMELKNITKEIKLINSLGTNKHTKLPENYADYLLLVDVCGAAIISKNDLNQYVRSQGDSLTAKIPCDKLLIISRPSDISLNENCKNLNVKDMIMETIMQIIHKE